MELLRSIFAQLGINKTFYVQFALVIVVYVFLSKVLFRPILTILVTRKHKVFGLKRMADEAITDAERMTEDFSKKWDVYEVQARNIKNEIHEKNSKTAKQIIKEASIAADKIVEDKRQESLSQIKGIEDALSKDIVSLSENATVKLIGGGKV
ncbi:MAG: ATP synthase F0 subunit B [bacterium]